MRAIRAIALFKLGAWFGLVVGAAFARRVLPSHGDEESDELTLVAALSGVELKSRAKAFRGGSMLAWFGGISVDLTDAELAPGARLSTNTLFGGIDIRVPPGWRIESSVKAIVGGAEARTPADADPDAPVLALDGLAVVGGIDVHSLAR